MTQFIGKTRKEAAINATLQAWGRAMGEKRAVDAVAELTDDVIQFTLAAPLSFEGKSAEGLAAWFTTWEGPIAGEVRNGRLTAGEDVAFWNGLMHMTGTKTDGIKVDLWFRQTLGLVKISGVWKIAHIHTSVPFAMDGSGLAELGLRP
jgi:ketosteroid isomerase-like protein